MYKKISVIGLGYVGLPLALEFEKHFNVVGFDVNKNRVKDLCQGKDYTKEVSAEQLKNSSRLVFSSNEKDIVGSDIFIVTVPTPIDESCKPNLNPLKAASELISNCIKKDSIVIYESTVFPGCTEEVCVPIIEKSNLKYNRDFYCGYSPERIVPGDKENTLTKISKIVSGSTPEITDAIAKLYKKIIKAEVYKAQSIKVAEAAKVIENTQRDMNIAIINEFSMIFNSLSIDTKSVLDAASTKWNFMAFNPGLVGGHCIGVDPYYLISKSIDSGYTPNLLINGRRINDDMPKYLADRIKDKLKDIKIDSIRFGIMGITFKANTPDIRNTKVIDLIRVIEGWGSQLSVYDPIASKKETYQEYKISLEDELDIKSYDVIILAVSHREFIDNGLVEINKLYRSQNKLLVDVNSSFSTIEAKNLGIEILRL